MASKYSVEPSKLLETLKSTLMPKATNEELLAFVVVANRYGLNPFTREIYAFPGRSGGITPVVSVDGWIHLMNSHAQFDGVNFVTEDIDGKPYSVTAKIYVKTRTHPVEVTEYLSECVLPTQPWKSHPRRMLRHKALIQAARLAFGFSGISDEEEAGGSISAAIPRPVFAVPVEPAPTVVDIVPDNLTGAEVPVTDTAEVRFAAAMAERAARE